MSWNNWLANNKMNIELGESSIDLMRRAYIAGLQDAYNKLYFDEEGDYDFVMWEIKNMIEHSK
jgi:hypothetical protein